MKCCPNCGKEMGRESESEYAMDDDAAIKYTVLADLMETMSKGMGSKLKKPSVVSIEIEKSPIKTSKMNGMEEEEEG